MGRARVLIAYDFLREILDLPAGSVMSDACRPEGVGPLFDPDRVFQITVEHPDISAMTDDSDGLPILVPQFKTAWAAVFEDWGKLETS